MSAGLGRCPKHGTVLVRATAPGQPDKWCYPCWSKTGQYLPGPDAEGACIAMSRFLVWVWCEAMAACHGYGGGGSWGWEHRRVALGQAVELGLLRIDWSQP